MGSINILLGRSRWRRRAVLPAEALSGIDAWGQPTFLFIAPSAAKRRAVERDFVAYRPIDEPCFAPSVRVLDEFLADLWTRHGDGRAVLPRRGAAVVAQRVLRDGATVWPKLANLGSERHVAAELVRLAEALAGAGHTDLPAASMDRELQQAITSVQTAFHELPRHIFRPTLLASLHELLAHPTPALLSQLRRFRTVILDDLIQPTPLERAVLVTLCRAFEAAGSHVVLSLETGRDLGGDEAGLFFEYDDVHRAAYALRPFQATRGLRRTLFTELIASGEAEVGIALRAGLKVLEPGTIVDDPEPPDLSDHLYGPRPLPVTTPEQATALLRDTVQLRRYADANSERRDLAQSIKDLLYSGVKPGDCVVAVPNLSAHAASYKAIFDDHGLPFRLGVRAPLSHEPMARLVLAVAGCAAAGFPTPDVLDILRSDLLNGAEARQVQIGRLRSWCAAAGVRVGLPSSWAAPLCEWFARNPRKPGLSADDLAPLLAQLDECIAPLAGLATAQTPGEWRDALVAQLTRLGLPDRALHAGLDGWGVLIEALDQMVLDLEIEAAEVTDPDALLQALSDTLAATTLRPDPRSGDRVEVIDLQELLGLTPAYLWVPGLTRSAFPGADAASFLVPAALLRELEVPRKGEWGRYLLSSVLRNALDDRKMLRLQLSWPQLEGGKPAAPSPLLQDLLNLPTLVPNSDGGTYLFGDLVGLDEHVPAAPVSWSHAMRFAAQDVRWRGVMPPADQSGLAHQRVVHDARTGPLPTPFEGMLGRAPADVPTSMGVTRLETYLKCPASFWYGEVLGLSRLDPATEDVAADRKGTVLHAILEAFLEPRLGSPLSAPLAQLQRELHGVAVTQIEGLRTEGGFAPALLDSLQDEWLAGLVDDRPRGVLAQWLRLEARHADSATPIEVEGDRSLQVGPIRLRARLDRLDKTHSGVVVIDYKSGAAPDRAKVIQGLALQPVVYAAMVAGSDDRPVASTYLTLRSPAEVRTTGWVGDVGVLDELGVKKGARLPLDSEQRKTYLQHAADGGRRMHHGVFHTTLADPKHAGCSYCPYARICRLDEARNEHLKESDADLQRPLDLEGEA